MTRGQKGDDSGRVVNDGIIRGGWKQSKCKAQARRGDLRYDVFDVSEGDSTYLAGKLQDKYGWGKGRARRELKEFDTTLQGRLRAKRYARDPDEEKARHCGPFFLTLTGMPRLPLGL